MTDVLNLCDSSSDLGMMFMLNAKEREYDDWAELFRGADERFRFLGVQHPPGAQEAIIEACWEESSKDLPSSAPLLPIDASVDEKRVEIATC